MIKLPSPEDQPPHKNVQTKPVWVRPTLDVVDIAAMTQNGGAASADSDPNQPS
jgi:hypothetical protein